MATMIYNKIHEQTIILNEDQHRCPRCIGAGYHPDCDGGEHGEYILIECHVCDGDGYVDWVTLAIPPLWKEYDERLMNDRDNEEWEENYWEEVEDCHSGSFTIDGDWEDNLGYG